MSTIGRIVEIRESVQFIADIRMPAILMLFEVKCAVNLSIPRPSSISKRLIRTWHWIILNYNVKHPNRRTNSKIKCRRHRGTCNLLCRAQNHETKTTTSCKWMYIKDHIFKPRMQIWRHFWTHDLPALSTELSSHLGAAVTFWVCNIPPKW